MEELNALREQALCRRIQNLTKQAFWARKMAVSSPPGEVSRFHWGTVQAINENLCILLLELGKPGIGC